MKLIKIICVVLMFSTSAQADFFSDVGDWVAGAASDTLDVTIVILKHLPPA